MIAGKTSGRLSGFTLVELLVTIAVAVVLATVAVPSFQSLVASNRQAADFNEILMILNRGRSHAVARRENVEVNFSVGAGGRWVVAVTAENDSTPVASASSRDGRVKLSPEINTITFDSLGRRGGCVAGACAIRVGDGGSEIFVEPSGRVSVRPII